MSNIEKAKEWILSRPLTSNTGSEEPGSWVCLQGVVESEQQIAAGFARIQAEGAPAQVHYITPGFTLRLTSGQIVYTKIAGEVRFLPEEKRRAHWGQLEADERYRPLAKRAPGPHVEVQGAHATLRPGDSVSVFGQLEEDPARRRQLNALAITAGASASNLMQGWYEATQKELSGSPEKAPSSVRKYIIRALLALLLLAAAYRTLTYLPSAIVTITFVLGLLFLSVVLDTKNLPPFYCYQPNNTQEVSRGSGLSTALLVLSIVPCWIPGLFITGFGSLSLLFVRIFGAEVGAREENDFKQIALWFSLTVFTSSLLFSLSFLLSGGPWKKLADLLRSAKPYNPSQPDGWASITGTLRDTTPVEINGRECAVYFMEQLSTTRLSRKRSTTTTKHEQESRSTFFIDIPHGSVEIDPRDAVWTSTTEWKGSSANGPDTTVSINARLLAQGDLVTAVGRIQDNKLASTGPQSLLLFGDAKNPNVVIDTLLRADRLSAAKMSALVLLMGAVVWYAIHTLL